MNKLSKLKQILDEMGSVVVAYSGGLDSTFLLKMAVDALGRTNVLAVTARSETYPISEYREAVSLAKQIGARHKTIATSELGIKHFKANPVNRCYYCKKELFKKLDGIREKRGLAYLLDGTNYDDLKDVRHGMKAARELGVRSPLLEAKLTKADIRNYSKKLNLPTWDKPSFACLASRFPFNDRIGKSALLRVGEAEDFLRALGFKQVRVRIHGNMARIELFANDLARAIKFRDKIVVKFHKLKFVYITLDLAGYRTGSMHEAESEGG